MKPNQCKKGMRIYVNVPRGNVHGEIVQVLIDDMRRVLVRWDGFVAPVEVDPYDLRPEIPAPVHDPEKLERWLDS